MLSILNRSPSFISSSSNSVDFTNESYGCSSSPASNVFQSNFGSGYSYFLINLDKRIRVLHDRLRQLLIHFSSSRTIKISPLRRQSFIQIVSRSSRKNLSSSTNSFLTQVKTYSSSSPVLSLLRNLSNKFS